MQKTELIMKKFFVLSSLAAFALLSCSKEVENPEVNAGRTVTIVASLDDTRTTETGAEFFWESTESISVGTSSDEYVSFEVDNASEGTFKHTFSSDVPTLEMAVTPAQNGIYTGTDAFEVELPSVYNNYVQGTTNALMIGTPNGANKFSFRHAAALVKVTYVNVPVGTTSFVFKADKNIAGKVTLGGLTANDIEIANDNDELDGKEVWINLPQPISAANSTLSFYVPVPTGDYSLLNIYLANAEGKITSTEKTMNRANKTPLTLARGDVFTFPKITLNEAVGDKYVKVESDLSDYTGDYLIVYEEGSVAFNGGLADLDVASNVEEVTISNSAIDFNPTTYGYQFHIAKIGNTENYSIQSKSGKYIGVSSNSNGLKMSENSNTYSNQISIDAGKNAVIAAVFSNSTMTMRYNSGSNQNRFRYYSSGQKSVALYKLNGRLDVNFPTLTAEDVFINADQTTAVVNFSTNQDWAVTATSDLLAENISFNGTKDDIQSVTLNFKAANETFDDKTVTVHIVAGTLSKDITVTQKGVAPTISVAPTSATVGADVTAASFKVTSNFDWHILSITVDGETASSSFIATVDADDATKVNVAFPANINPSTTTSTRSIVVTVGDADIKDAKFTITQNGHVNENENEKTDVITLATTGVTGTSYSNWSGKTVSSDAVYAGNSAGGNSSIQLRSGSSSGIISTTSGGKLAKVSVVWNSNTLDGRTINIYGSRTAYSSASQLYNSEEYGTLLGSLVCGTSTELTVEGNYKYIGIRSSDGALYLTEVKITWDTSAPILYGISVASGITNGTVSVTKGGNLATEAEEGDEITLTATAATGTPGYKFVQWNVEGLTLTDAQKKTNPLTIEMPANTITVSASFEEKSTVPTLQYTLDGTVTSDLSGSSNYDKAVDFAQEGITWNVMANTNVNPWRFGGKNLSGVDREAYSKTALNSSVNEISVELGGITLTVNSIKLIVASDASFSNVIDAITKNEVTANSTLSFEKPSTHTWSNCFFKFIFNVTAGSSNSYVQFKKAEFIGVD